jgi:endonuclease/exonuclease/phosphatase family metal-dependent hydrolase
VAFDPYEPYGPVVETTVRIVEWNVWGRYGEWEARERALLPELARVEPDIVCLAETWLTNETTQAERVGAHLGLAHNVSIGGFQTDDWNSGIGVASRWPITAHEQRALPAGKRGANGSALFVRIDGPRGDVQLFVAMLDYPLNGSGVRQEQVRELCRFVDEQTSARYITVVCGDFNAGPDADEIRMLTGRTEPPVEHLVFYDAWEIAGDGTPGITWSNENPLARVGHYPDRRFDYVFSAWPRLGAAGHPTHCELLGTNAEISDHYGVLATLRY